MPENIIKPEIVFLVEEDVEDGYIAQALGHSIFTQGETLDELREMIKDAIHCHFDEPRIIRLHFVHDEVIYA